jgi:hypothetical protein
MTLETIAATITKGIAMIISQILTVAAIWASWWSLSSGLWDSLGAVQWAAVIAALILTVGAVIEYWVKLKLLMLLIGKWIFLRSTAFDRCTLKKLLAHSLGPILVVIGIAGDFIFEGRAFILEDRQEEQAQKIVGSLKDKADAVSGKADLLSHRLDGITTTIDVTEDSAGKAERAAGKLRTELADTETQLDQETKERADLENSMLPRDLKLAVLPDGRTSVDPLRPYAEFSVSFWYIPDAEAKHAAGAVASAILEAGWHIEPSGPVKDLADGVVVNWVPLDKPQLSVEEKATNELGEKAAKALAKYLTDSGWSGVTAKPLPDFTHSVKQLRVAVGFAPNTFMDKALADKAKELIMPANNSAPK